MTDPNKADTIIVSGNDLPTYFGSTLSASGEQHQRFSVLFAYQGNERRGVTHHDQIRNKDIRDRYKVVLIVNKLQETVFDSMVMQFSLTGNNQKSTETTTA